MDDRIIAKKLELLQGLEVEATLQLEHWSCRTANYNAPGDYTWDDDWNSTDLPVMFPPRKTVFLKTVAEVPAENLKDLYFVFDFRGMEGALRIDGKLYCGIDINHMRIPVPRAGKMELLLEFNSVPNALFEPEQDRYGHGEFRSAAIHRIDRIVEAFRHDTGFVHECACVIDDERRKKRMLAALEKAMLGVNLTLPRAELDKEAAASLEKFRADMKEIAPDPESGTLCAIGHTHIDTAWLWPLKETVRKCSRTFSTACRYMEIFPDYHFSCSQAQLYDYTREHYPELFAEIKKHVKNGRWENTGAMWVEPDCNVPNGESLIRQILYGLKFYREEFGTRPELCWLPDVFGYPASLPEILVSCGLRYFSTNKLHWQAKEPFPDHLFVWRGLDGSEILSHIAKLPNFYNGFITAEQLHTAWKDYEQKDLHDELLYPFGYGDGGGGVTEEMMERIKRAKTHIPGMPNMRIDTVEGFFHNVERKAPELPVWDGELYLQTHRGTYTTHAEIKKANRISETMLREAEILAVFAAWEGKKVELNLEKAWKTMLLNQFHDILPGSSITEIYPRSLADYNEVKDTAQQSIRNTVAELGCTAGESAKLRVFNTLSWERRDPFIAEAVAGDGALEAIAADGTVSPVQRTADGKLLISGAAIPAMGYIDFTIQKAQKSVDNAEFKVCETLLENALLRVELNERGDITRIYDKELRREVLAPNAVGGELQLFQDGPEDEDAWNLQSSSFKRRYPFDSEVHVSVVESGACRGVIRVVRTYRASRFEQDIIFYRNSKRLDFAMRVDWQVRNTLLKIAFPLEIRTTRATCEVQFGAFERATHRNTLLDQQKFEIPIQRWADLSESNYGITLINDSRFGCDVLENTLRLSLLRGTIHPDPVADYGYHEMSCSLVPHGGDWAAAEIVRRGWEFNTPMTVGKLPADAVSESASFLSLSGYDGAVVQTVKPAEDGNGFIVRIYEANGGRGNVKLHCAFPVREVVECNSVEEGATPVLLKENIFNFNITPYQIKTFKFVK